jgi:uncharacterized delta-60 repeat protein
MPWAMALDKDGNVIVVGSSVANVGADYITIKYDRLGNELWKKRFNGPNNSQDEAQAVATDAQGNVYVAGQSGATNNNWDFLTIKYGPNGDFIWQRRYDGQSFWSERPNAITIQGDVIAITGMAATPTEGSNVETVVYDVEGNQLWAKSFKGDGAGTDEGQAVAFGPDGSIFVAGHAEYTETGLDFLLVKYSETGRKMWAKHFDSGSKKYDLLAGMQLDSDGHAILAGTSMNKSGNTDFTTIKVSQEGNKLWSAKQDSAGERDEMSAMTLDNDGNVIVVGSTGNSYNTLDATTIKYHKDGMKLWSKRYSANAEISNSTDSANAVAVDDEGNVYVAGTSQGVLSFDQNMTMIKYAADGKFKSVDTFGAEDGVNQFSARLVVDRTRHRAYTTGYIANAENSPLDILTIRN